MYFGSKKDKDGLLIGKDWISKEIVYKAFIQSETKLVYQVARNTLEKAGFKILAVVIDGRPGIRSIFSDLPIQMCQFHQIQIVNRYLTKRPKLTPALQLRTLLDDLTKNTEYGFKAKFNYWLEVNSEFLNEKTVNPNTKRKVYTHKRLRSAVKSIQTNLNYLFTYQEFKFTKVQLNQIIDKLRFNSKIESLLPNTTNSLDGWFAHLRKLLNCHNGLRKDRRNRLIEYILATRNFN